MTWNNRIVRIADDGVPEYYAVCEVFYDNDAEYDTPSGYAILRDLAGDTAEEVRNLVSYIYRDIIERDLPVMESENL